MRRMPPAETAAPSLPLSIFFASDQVSWLTSEARSRRISRSALVRQAVDALMAQQQQATADQDN